MQAFFDKMKDGNNSELDGKFNGKLSLILIHYLIRCFKSFVIFLLL
jgi:hypothetical protein